MDVRAITSLVAVADQGSYSKAAIILGCSKAHVSQQIKTLENNYKVQLVVRTTRSVKLTSAGEDFVRQCKKALMQMKDAEDFLLQNQEDLRGTIRIASIGGIFGEQYIAPAIYSFMDSYPEIKVELDFSSLNIDLISNNYDIAIRFGDLPDSTLIARNLILYRPTLVAAPNYIKQFGAPGHPSELTHHRLISGTNRQWTFQHNKKEFMLRPDGHLRCGNGTVMLQACLDGLGIAHLPSMYIQKAVTEGTLEILLPQWSEELQPCNIVYPPSRYRLQRVQALVSHLRTTAATW